MEGDAAAVTDFQDWELLANSDSDLVNSPISMANSSRGFEEIVADTEGMLRLDYFSLENDNRYVKTTPDATDEGSVESDNPSWIDPGSETRFQRRNSSEVWPDSGSDRSDDRKSGDFNVKNELGLVENKMTDVGFEEIEAKEGKFESLEGKVSSYEGKSELGFEGFGETQSKDKELVKFWSVSGGDDLFFGDVGKDQIGSEILGESEGENESKEVNLSFVAVGETKPGDEVEKRKLVWWKVPFEMLRYCVFRFSPVWSVSVAAAVMGFVILGRRLYKMKRKTKSLQLKVTVDDKCVLTLFSPSAILCLPVDQGHQAYKWVFMIIALENCVLFLKFVQRISFEGVAFHESRCTSQRSIFGREKGPHCTALIAGSWGESMACDEFEIEILLLLR
ncbi:hypothetical protein DKX38_019909 [Salix brachista]|uniref:Uncharacterized protein n=1 Tax=Salix brachista TaxID=2182728 RepID=A0A5N5KHT4_9ROSI|nr:hypothetical protein DKX38_019909 [Salix brachista]